MSIAWGALSPIQRVQLLHCLPLLRANRCKRCGGNVMKDGDGWVCLQCGHPHTENGDLITPRSGKGINLQNQPHFYKSSGYK
jgi:tRNA(Ile2) C34 agmatinyltransferase TiaS